MPEAERPAPGPRVNCEWVTRSAAEYASAAFAHHLSFWLIQIGAPKELVFAGLEVVEDELRHAEACGEAARLAGAEAHAEISRAHLELPRDPGEPLEHALVRGCVSAFCVDETLAVTLFANMQRRATVPEIAAMARGFLADEVHHREFGWVTLEWLLARPGGDALRGRAEDAFARSLGERREQLLGGAERARGGPAPEDMAWGCMPAGVFVEVFRGSLVSDIARRMQRTGLSLPPGFVAESERRADAILENLAR